MRRRLGVGEDRGANAVEYGLIVFAIAAVVAIAAFALGGVTQTLFTDTCSDIASAASASC